MRLIFNKDANEIFEYLKEKKLRANLQVHDIPYVVSVKDSNIKLDGRTDMIRDFGEWDHKEIDLELLSKNISDTTDTNGSVIVFFNNYGKISELVNHLSNYFDKVDILVWSKSNPRPQIRKRSFVQCHELLVYARRGNYTFNFSEHGEMYSNKFFDGSDNSVQYSGVCSGSSRLRNKNGEIAHATQKPWKLLTHYINIMTNPGDLVIDLYAGVLTTAYSSLITDRNFIVNDLEGEYVNLGIDWLNSLNKGDFCIES